MKRYSNKIIQILSITIGILTVMPGVMKLTASSNMIKEFNEFGLPHWMLIYIGIAEVIVGIGLFIKSVRFFAAFANVLLLTWAITATMTSGMYLFATIPFLLFILSVLITVFYYKQLLNSKIYDYTY